MIYILEIPHQRPASCWSRATQSQILGVIAQQAMRSGESIDNYVAALDWLGSDLNTLHVFDSDEEALDAMGDLTGHQAGAAYTALRDELISTGAISPVDTSSVESMRDEAAPLYCQYPGQSTPQPAYIEMDENGAVSASYSGEIGNGAPAAVWHSRTLRFDVSSSLSGAALADMVADDAVQSLLARIHAGHRVEWDGSNHTGALTSDAEAARDDLAGRLTEDEGDLQIISAEDWLFSSCSLGEHWDGGDLSAAVETLESYVDEHEYIDGDLRASLIGRAREMAENDLPGLNAGHLSTLVAEGEITQAAADAYAEIHN